MLTTLRDTAAHRKRLHNTEGFTINIIYFRNNPRVPGQLDLLSHEILPFRAEGSSQPEATPSTDKLILIPTG